MAKRRFDLLKNIFKLAASELVVGFEAADGGQSVEWLSVLLWDQSPFT